MSLNHLRQESSSILAGKDLFAHIALGNIPKILTLLDRNPHSPTYGCFDRNFWHYRIIDFPSGMAQEFVWPLTLAYTTNIQGSPYYRKPVMRDWVEAGITYAAKTSHNDGSCDDYFPHERAVGASAFSLLAFIESYKVLQLDNDPFLHFFEKRANWLANKRESGKLTNHQALIVLCLELLSQLLKTRKWDRQIEERLETVFSWQSREGWYQEYEGCDPGYHTLTTSLLAQFYELSPFPKLKDSLVIAVQFADHFIHPDGSYGGEYGSRNTYNFFPHGFELIGKWMPEALRINNRFLKGLNSGLRPCFEDDHIIGHHTWNYLLAWRDFVEDRPQEIPRTQGRTLFKDAKILIDRREDSELYIGLNKGGVFKLFRKEELVASDTNFSIQIVGNRERNAVAHLVDSYDFQIKQDEVQIRGDLGWAKHFEMCTMKLVLLRLLMLSLGRFVPNAVRKVLQKITIMGKKRAPFSFSRLFKWENARLIVIDEVSSDSWEKVKAIGIGGNQTSILNVTSRTFDVNQLDRWIDLTNELNKPSTNKTINLERIFLLKR